MSDIDDAGYETELFDAYAQAAAACEMRAGDFPKGSSGRKAHLKAASVIMKLADKTIKLPEESRVK